MYENLTKDTADWFSIWSDDSTLGKSEQLKQGAGIAKVASSVLGAVEGLSALSNNTLAKKQRNNERLAIANQVLAAQDSIIESLAYNTDQAVTYAARGNVAISSPVMTERFKKGASEAGRDFAMIKSNAEIEKIKSDVSYARKRRAATQKAIGGITNLMFNVGMYGMNFGGGAVASEVAAE